MLAFLQRQWESGADGCLIEDMITAAFSDFAPYAGAEQQHLRFVRRQADGTISNLVYEDDGNWSVNIGNPHIGGFSFTTTNELFCDLRLRIPLLLRGANANAGRDSSMRKSPEVTNNATHEEVLYARQNFQYAVPPPRGPHGSFGALEVLYSYVSGGYGAGIRLGPFSMRAVALPSAVVPPQISKSNPHSRFPLVMDASLCVPLESMLESSLNSSNAATKSSAVPFYRLTLGVQHAFGVPDGDTLAALCLHAAPNGKLHDDLRVLVVQTLASGNKAVRPPTNEASSLSRSAFMLSETNWREMGTLVGVQKSFGNGLVRVSASAMVHERDMDYEAAVVGDARSLFNTPTVLKIGINRARRIAVGVVTKVIGELTLTLGVHCLGGDMRFGLEVAM
ncbi:hypothetical protein ERJ75_000142400 [Trypanosoma vivax]|uniref:Uncharacterized protein n=1 Tax=Trypanosoma vivax (strain Y486) TaxID=1055687 RepID=G0TYB1_TRYVY|nr:hypothetical protein TRVL_00186 [Trypanosoma vivax]KAH8619778.1 hypothetical protein ERJ75_000142400 [Trypanosoma vivax]CCC48956.1 conserved hypothetical protein [Trypanosoma vivax Y486]